MEHNQICQVSYSLEKNKVEAQNPLKKTGGNHLRKALRVVEQTKEAGKHKKNGERTKCQRKRISFIKTRNMNRILLSMTILSMLIFTSCITCKEGCTQLKADYIAFSDNVYPSYQTNNCVIKWLQPRSEPFNLETENGKFKLGLMKLTMGEKTSAYYALDKGLDRVKNVRKNIWAYLQRHVIIFLL
jgi:hypothetical protein